MSFSLWVSPLIGRRMAAGAACALFVLSAANGASAKKATHPTSSASTSAPGIANFVALMEAGHSASVAGLNTKLITGVVVNNTYKVLGNQLVDYRQMAMTTPEQNAVTIGSTFSPQDLYLVLNGPQTLASITASRTYTKGINASQYAQTVDFVVRDAFNLMVKAKYTFPAPNPAPANGEEYDAANNADGHALAEALLADARGKGKYLKVDTLLDALFSPSVKIQVFKDIDAFPGLGKGADTAFRSATLHALQAMNAQYAHYTPMNTDVAPHDPVPPIGVCKDNDLAPYVLAVCAKAYPQLHLVVPAPSGH